MTELFSKYQKAVQLPQLQDCNVLDIWEPSLRRWLHHHSRSSAVWTSCSGTLRNYGNVGSPSTERRSADHQQRSATVIVCVLDANACSTVNTDGTGFQNADLGVPLWSGTVCSWCQTVWHVTAVSVRLWACEVVYQRQNTNNFTGLLICILSSWCHVMTQKQWDVLSRPEEEWLYIWYWNILEDVKGQKQLNWHVWNSSDAQGSSIIAGTTVVEVTSHDFSSRFD